MTSHRKSFAISALSKYLLLGLQFFSTTILARLLTPEDIGVYSIAFSIVLFGHLIRNFGVNQFVIQEKELTKDKLKAAFCLTLMIAWSIAIILFLGSDFIGSIYQNDGISNVIKLLSINFILLPFSSITHSYLRRKMEFKKVAIIDIVPGFFGVAVAITSAYYGAKFYTMAFAANTEILITIIISMFFRPKELPFLPGFKQLGYVFKFGSRIGLGNMISQLSLSLTDLFIGRFFGLSKLGLYSRAYGTYMLYEYAILEGIGPVVLPVFSSAKNNGQNIKKLFIQAMEYATAFAVPFFGFIYLFTDDFIHVLYGNQWDEAIPLIKVFCFAGVFLSIISFFDHIMISIGKVRVVLRYQILSHSLFLLLLYKISQYNQLKLVAWCFFGLVLTRILLALNYYKKYLKLGVLIPIKIQLRGMIISAFILAPAYGIQLFYGQLLESEFIRLPLYMLVCFFSWILFLFIFKHPFSHELRLIYLKLLKKTDS